jgi:hypothetical protein
MAVRVAQHGLSALQRLMLSSKDVNVVVFPIKELCSSKIRNESLLFFLFDFFPTIGELRAFRVSGDSPSQTQYVTN